MLHSLNYHYYHDKICRMKTLIEYDTKCRKYEYTGKTQTSKPLNPNSMERIMNGQTPSHPSANLIQWHQENPDIQAIITSINNHHLSILEGRYDTQRSSCTYQVAIELIAQHQTVVLFTFWRSAEEVGIQLTSQLAQLNPEILKQGQLTEQNWAQLTQAIEQINQAELLICDECPMTTAMLRKRVQHISNQRPIQLIIIDYLQLLQKNDDDESTIDPHHEKTLKQLEKLSADLHIPLLLLSHSK